MPKSLSSLARSLAIAWIVAVIVLVAIQALLPQRSGLVALTEVFEPYVVITAILAVPLALLRRTRVARLLVGVLLIVCLGRYLPGWVSIPAGGSPVVTVATWNVLGGPGTAARTREGVLATDTDLVALVELQPGAVAALQAQPAITTRLPYWALDPDTGLMGLGLLSRFPIVDQTVSKDPPFLRAETQLPDGRALIVYVIHPQPPDIRTLGSLPVSLQTGTRDAELDAIRAVIDTDIAAGRSVMIAGDFNTTEREPAYLEFVRGLNDAHLDAGIGPGLTWRPEELEGWPFGIVRIDYLLTTPDLQAISTHVVCNALSDHCLLAAAFH